MSMFGGVPLEGAPAQSGSRFGGMPVETAAPGNALDEANALIARRRQSQKDFEQREIAENQAKPWYQNLIEAIPRGAERGTLGLLQTLGAVNPEDAADVAKQTRIAGEGTGIAGAVGEAGLDPRMAATLPLKLANLAGRGVVGSAIGYTDPVESTDPGEVVKERLSNAGKSGAAFALLPPVLEKTIGKPIGYVANKLNLPDYLTQAADKINFETDTGKLYDAARQIGLDVRGKGPQDVLKAVNEAFAGATDQAAGHLSGKTFNPSAANAHISDRYADAQKQANQLYDAAKGSAGDDVLDATGLVRKLDSTISSLEGNTLPGTGEHQALQQLKAVRSSIVPETTTDVVAGGKTAPKIGVGDLLDLRSTLNEGFNGSRFATKGDATLSGLTNEVRGLLNGAGEINEGFGKALADHDAFQADLGGRFKGNEVLAKFWTPDDLQAFRALQDRGIPLPDATRQRASRIVDNIGDINDLHALESAMPKDMYDALRAEKLRQMFAGARNPSDGTFNVRALNTVLNPDKRLNPNAELLGTLIRDNPEAQKMLDAVRSLSADLQSRGYVSGHPEPGMGHDLGEAAVSAALHEPVTAGRQALRALTKANKGPVKGFASEINQGEPLNLARGASALLTGAAAETLGETGPAQPKLPPPVVEPLPDPLADPSPQTNAGPLVQRIAQAESGNNPNAKNPNSSASGSLQFTDGTWAMMVAKYGKQTGIGLKDKNNPEAQQIMGNLLTEDNSKIMTKKLGRAPTEGELYAAHVFGAGDVMKLIQAQGSGRQAITLYPRKLVAGNRSIFFDKSRPRTVEEVYALLNNKIAG